MIRILILGALALALTSCAFCYSPSACGTKRDAAMWGAVSKEIRKW